MEWVKKLHGAIVGLDTAPLIYLIEESPVYLSMVRPFFEAVDRGQIRVVTSTLTVTEVLVHPLRRGDKALAERYRHILLRAKHLTTVPVSDEIAEQAALLRAVGGLRTPDAIQVATAAFAGASAFLTNDRGLARLSAPPVLVLEDLISAGR